MGFEQWGNCHNTEDQQKRLLKAKEVCCTPLSVSKENSSATFSGSHGIYETTLESCGCVDFSRRHLPCKHIYRLALELGLISGSVKSDKSRVKTPTPKGLSISTAVAVLESISDEARRFLYETLYSMFYRFKSSVVGVRQCPELKECIEAGILEQVDNVEMQAKAFTRNELRDLLLAVGINNFKKNSSLDSLVRWVCENVPNAIHILSSAMAVRLCAPFIKPSRKMYTYLRKLYDISAWEDMTQRVDVSFDFSSAAPIVDIKKAEIEQDEITKLFYQYGHKPLINEEN